jgi:hypothetical protein
MDRHCVTVCPMRPMKCPFGCDSSFAERDLEKHCLEFLQAHLLKVLKVIHKKGRSEEELKELAQKLEKVWLLIFLNYIICFWNELSVLFASGILCGN